MKFILLALMLVGAVAGACNWNCSGGWYTGYYPCGTCGYCKTATAWQTINKTLNTLPISFSYSHGDTNTGNDTCGTSDCGTISCGGPVVSFSNNKLPIPAVSNQTAQCNFSSLTKVPTTVTSCSWQDGYCQTYYDRYCPYEYCGDWSCD